MKGEQLILKIKGILGLSDSTKGIREISRLI